LSASEIVSILLDTKPKNSKEMTQRKHDADVISSARVPSSVLDSTDDRSVFPLKETICARTKVNVFFRDVWKDAKTFYPDGASYLARNSHLMEGMYNDQASAWVIWFVVMFGIDQSVAKSVLEVARDNDVLSDLSDTVKQAGAASERVGAMIVELRSLTGRGASKPDPDGDVENRIDMDKFTRLESCGITGDDVMYHLENIVAEEMQVRPVWMDPDEYWSKRWLFTKAGSHQRRVEKEKFGKKLDLPDQPTRREFSECVKDNMIAFGEACGLAGQSWKLEHYKTRAIYSVDTINYYTFDYLLKPVEEVWANKSCLLDPGGRPPSELYPQLGRQDSWYLMLDYENYNAQHRKDAMKKVIEVVCRGAPEHVLKWALDSIDNEWVFWKSSDGTDKKAKTVGGLFSGHRATTMINTLLNSAYIRAVTGGRSAALSTLHAGDDILVLGSREQVEDVLSCVLNSGIKVNPSKQGLGRRCGEFLRTSFDARSARGYFGRSVSSLVSGSWVSEAMLSKEDALSNYTRQMWTMCVRSGDYKVGHLLTTTISRRVPEVEQYISQICSLTMGVNGSPVLATASDTVAALKVEGNKMRARFKAREGTKSYATDLFMKEHMDKGLMSEAKISPSKIRSLMLEVSYKASIVEGGSQADDTVSTFLAEVPSRDLYHVGVVTDRNLRSETRSESQAAKILSRLVGNVDWERIVHSLSGDVRALADKVAPSSWPITNSGTLGLAELSTIRNRMLRPLAVMTDYPVRV
jgi:hypothetical protein